jgi:terminase small subunit / prophage DNA-packing protein
MRGANARDISQCNPMPEGNEVTAKELADLLGLEEPTIRQLYGQGLLVRIRHGVYDRRLSVRAYCENIRAQAARWGSGARAADLTAERARETRERADNLALRNAQLRGEMVSVADVERQWADTLRGLRSRLLALPSRLQQRLGRLSPHDVATIDRELRDALTEMGRDDAQ